LELEDIEAYRTVVESTSRETLKLQSISL
jgi:hypothetical protein